MIGAASGAANAYASESCQPRPWQSRGDLDRLIVQTAPRRPAIEPPSDSFGTGFVPDTSSRFAPDTRSRFGPSVRPGITEAALAGGLPGGYMMFAREATLEITTRPGLFGRPSSLEFSVREATLEITVSSRSDALNRLHR
jgi:hypothetical protein